VQCSTFFSDIPESTPYGQGDIIRCDNVDGKGSAGWAIIVTADCDIAQSKMGPFFTCLEIVTAVDYVTHFWASDEIHKLVVKFESRGIDLIHTADSRRDPKVTPLSSRDLELWLREESPSGIVARIGFGKAEAAECLQALEIVSAARRESEASLDRLRGIWTILRRSKKDQDGALANALKPSQMRSDYVFLPSLPGEREIGFVVPLRAVRPIAPSRIHSSALALRISGNGSDFYRLGRLADFLRYSVAQQWAALYSRIGMTRHFENECAEVARLLLAERLGG
jgi:hypothetical protein